MTAFETSSDARLTLLTRVDCGLCEDAERDLRRLGARFECVDIDDEPGLQRLYDEVVPVILLDGAELAHAPLSEKTLRLAVDLSEAPS